MAASGIRRIQQSEHRHLGVVRLRRSDLEELLQLLEDNFENCSIELDEFAITGTQDIDEVASRSGRAHTMSLKVDCRSPSYFTVALSSDEAVIRLLDNADVKLLGVATRVEKIFKRRRGLLRYLPEDWRVGLLLAAITYLPLGLNQLGLSDGFIIAGSVLSFAALAWVGATVVFLNFRRSVIELVRGSGVPGFLARSGDQLVISLIVVIVTAAISVATTLLLAHGGNSTPPMP